MKRRFVAMLSEIPAAAGSAPEFSSAEIGAVNAYTLVVTFSADISASNYATGVTIKVNTVSQTITSATRQADHAVVYYEIPDGFFVNTDIVTWEYTGGNIVSESGAVVLATVTTQTVTNNEEIMKTTVTLTNAQIKALPTTPVEIIAAPGANKLIQMMDAFVSASIAASGDYTNMSVDIAGYIGYEGGGDIFSFADDSGAGLTQVSDLLVPGGESKASQRLYPYPDSLDAGWGLIFPLQAAGAFGDSVHINLDNTLGNLTGGNAANTLTVTIVYIVIDLS